jgi:amino acid permease
MTYKSGENSYRKPHMTWESQQNKPCICGHYKKKQENIEKRWKNKQKRWKNKKRRLNNYWSTLWMILSLNVNDPKPKKITVS